MAYPIIFAFGPGSTWVIGTQTKRFWSNVPDRLDTVLKNSSNRPLTCAFGPGKPDQYFFSWEDKDGKTWHWRNNLPEKLEKWVFDGKYTRRDHKTLSVTLGPNNSFFAMDKDGYRWDNLPESLENGLQEYLSPTGWIGKAPMSVALGVDGTFAMLTASGSVLFNLAGKYDKLRDHLKWTGFKDSGPKAIFLDAFDPGHYFLATHKGTASLNTPFPEQYTKAMIETLPVTTPQPPETVASISTTLASVRETADLASQQLFNARETIRQQAEALNACCEALKEARAMLERNQRQNDNSAATALAQANQQANNDFLVRQAQQAREIQNAYTNMLSMQVQTNAVIGNIARARLW